MTSNTPIHETVMADIVAELRARKNGGEKFTIESVAWDAVAGYLARLPKQAPKTKRTPSPIPSEPFPFKSHRTLAGSIHAMSDTDKEQAA